MNLQIVCKTGRRLQNSLLEGMVDKNYYMAHFDHVPGFNRELFQAVSTHDKTLNVLRL